MADNAWMDSVTTAVASATGLSALWGILHRRQNARIKAMEDHQKTLLPRKEGELMAELVVEKLSAEFKKWLHDYYLNREQVELTIDNTHEKIILTISPLKEDVSEIKSEMKKIYDMLFKMNGKKD